MDTDDSDMASLRDQVRSARRQYKAGGGTVLDILLRSAGSGARLVERLRTHAGVTVLRDTAAVRPDFSHWDVAAARESRCVIVRVDEGSTLAAMEDPWDESLLQQLGRRLGQVPPPAAVPSGLIDEWLSVSGADALLGEARAASDPIDAADGPIVRFVDAAIVRAVESGASDVHFECDRTGITVKHRLDGVLSKFARLDGTDAPQEVISRIKVLAQLDITERRLPQDGRFRFDKGGSAIDLRVSVMPSVFGEDAVLRLLDKAQLHQQKEVMSLDRLGFDAQCIERIRDLAGEPSGMLLVTGPTGSGKTTTVYAVLSEINSGQEKIITIEDPVEYELPGVLQIPVNERKGLGFATGLRSILRHDPDRILVGEIRDAETAAIAVQSALTGHLVFTTVHANSMTDIIGRFRHFGLDMFGFMSSLNGVVVQRLVRRLCADCAAPRPIEPREREWLARSSQACLDTVPRAVGCTSCRGTGYRGRFVVAEVHVVDDALRDQVSAAAPVSALRRHADQRGVVPLTAQAAMLVVAGATTIEEVRRVVGWD